MSERRTVIIVEDDPAISSLIQLHINDLGHESICFDNGLDALRHGSTNAFDLMILDLNLPGLNGMSVCQELRKAGNQSAILMLTARTEEIDKVSGLENGADDYMTKPFSIRELLARVKALLRRVEPGKKEGTHKIISVAGIFIEHEKRRVSLNDVRVELTPKEYDLLYLLASHPGVTFDRKQLLDAIWGQDFEGYEHTVNTHINRLRIKIEVDPNKPEYVLTTWGVGYRFRE